jgi:hypothetical protein
MIEFFFPLLGYMCAINFARGSNLKFYYCLIMQSRDEKFPHCYYSKSTELFPLNKLFSCLSIFVLCIHFFFECSANNILYTFYSLYSENFVISFPVQWKYFSFHLLVKINELQTWKFFANIAILAALISKCAIKVYYNESSCEHLKTCASLFWKT